jgi:hypothetical protein
MAVAVDDFVKGLEQSGIISPGELQAVRDTLHLGFGVSTSDEADGFRSGVSTERR